VTLELFADPNGNGLADDGGAPLMSTVTDGTGAYSFTNLADGDFTVVETDPFGAISTNDAEGDLWDSTIGLSFVIGNETSSDNDFLDNLAYISTVSGVVLNDNDLSNDDFLGWDDTPIGGVEITLVGDLNGNRLADPGEPVLGQTRTDSDGYYSFPQLTANDYVEVETDPPGAVSEDDVEGA
jgi:hypothetical protein